MKRTPFGKNLKQTVLAVPAAALMLGMSTSSFAANLYAGNNGNFLDFGFIYNSHPASYLSNWVVWLEQRDFKYQFQNMTAVSSTGTMPASQYPHLTNWIQTSRATDPAQKIILWISGTEAEVNAGQSVWTNVANLCQMFFTNKNYAVDGINLDFEPFEPAVTNYIQFFKTIRNEVGTNVFLSLDYTADASAFWAPKDFKAASGYLNWIMPMLYDSSSTTISQYDAFISLALTYQYTNLATGCQLYPIIPYYATDPYHNTNVENIETAAIEITNLINSRQIKIAGLSVYWQYGWDATADIQWSNEWLNIQLPLALPPAMTRISPTNGPPAGGTLVAIYGSNFVSGDTVQFGQTTPHAANFINSTNLTVTTPTNTAGAVNVTVEDFYSQTSTLNNGFTYLPPPPATISSLVQAGGNLILVWQGGTNLNCVLLTSTNVALPTAQWTPVTTNTVGANGLSTNIIPINPGQARQFYLLMIP